MEFFKNSKMETFYKLNLKQGCNKDQNISGLILRQPLSEAIEFYSFKFECKREFKVNFQGSEDTNIYIIVNLDMKCKLTMDLGGNSFGCSPFSSLFMPVTSSVRMAFVGLPNIPYNFLLVRMKQSHLDEDQVSLLKWLEDEDEFLNPKHYERTLAPNLTICELSRQLRKIDEFTYENKLIALGYCNLLFGHKLKEFIDDATLFSHPLNTFEMKQLEILTEQIKKEPEKQYTIKEICKQTGLSVSKLQLGFKEMHNTTVALFIRNVRLEMALDLLTKTNMNIAEVVYSIGLTSRSYFCRVFKKRFKCSPKNYQQLRRMSRSS